jgi:hypothetical protein
MLTFEQKCEILAELRLTYEDEVMVSIFAEYDISAPLAVLVAEGTVTGVSQTGVEMIDSLYSDITDRFEFRNPNDYNSMRLEVFGDTDDDL